MALRVVDDFKLATTRVVEQTFGLLGNLFEKSVHIRERFLSNGATPVLLRYAYQEFHTANNKKPSCVFPTLMKLLTSDKPRPF